MKSAKTSPKNESYHTVYYSKNYWSSSVSHHLSESLVIKLADGTFVAGIKGWHHDWDKGLFSRYRRVDSTEIMDVVFEFTTWPLSEADSTLLEMIGMAWLKQVLKIAMFKKDAKVRRGQ